MDSSQDEVAQTSGEEAPAGTDPALPGPVREWALNLAAETLGAMPATEVPSRLRAVARFVPARRARLGAGPLAASLESDAAFRARVAEVARVRAPELADDLMAGRTSPVADPVEVAALAYVLQAPDWQQWVTRATEALATDHRTHRLASEQVARLQEQLEAVRSEGREALDEQRDLVTQARAETASLRGAVADARRAVAAAERRAREAEEREQLEHAEATRDATAAARDIRKLRERVSAAEAALEASRQAARAGRSAEDVRLRLLLDTVVDASMGLRRELALPPVPTDEHPADAVAGQLNAAGDTETHTRTEAVRPRAWSADDPRQLDQLLELPQVHVVVDGYNVTKTGYGTLPLESQRTRLVTGLAGLAARTGAEVTCVFDGADVDHPTAAPAPRRVRVVFSPAGVTADSVIRRLVRAEPVGRPVVVVSSDREVIDGVVQAGARAVASVALVRRLDRA